MAVFLGGVLTLAMFAVSYFFVPNMALEEDWLFFLALWGLLTFVIGIGGAVGDGGFNEGNDGGG